MNKKRFYYSSRFWVITYAVVVFVIMCMQFTLGLFDKYSIVFHNKTLNDFVNGNLSLPVTVLSYGWTALISLYCCADRIVDISKTTKLAVGQMSMGDLKKLRGMIVLSLFLFTCATVFNFIVERDFDLAAWASAFAMTVISYALGNKVVKASSYFGTHEDKDENGIPDKYQERYDKWKREQEKNGVEFIYINWNYFLDDPANEDIEKEVRPGSVKPL